MSLWKMRGLFQNSTSFTSVGSTTFTVPDVSFLWFEGCSAGQGGAGGNSTPGGGGGGGSSGLHVAGYKYPVTPGDILTIVIPSAGAAGAINGAGGLPSGPLTVTSAIDGVILYLTQPAVAPTAGGNPNGGSGGALSGGSFPVGDADAGNVGVTVVSSFEGYGSQSYSTGSGGGALNFSGGIHSSSAWGSIFARNSARIENGPIQATGGANGGGGGNGGSGFWGLGGRGGSNGGVFTAGIGYGFGGGGGSGNQPGGAGGPAILRIYW